MPLSKPAFRIPITTANVANTNDPRVKPELKAAVKSGKLRFKPAMPDDDQLYANWTPRIAEVDDAYDDFAPLYGNLLKYFLTAGRSHWHSNFATPAYAKEMENQLDFARDSLRDFDFEDIADPGIPQNSTPLAATQHILANSPGIVLGNDHGDKAPHDLLHAALDSGNVGLVFVEEIKTNWQPMIDEYLDSPVDEFPPQLKTQLDTMQDTFKLDFAGLLRKTKQKGGRLYGIDASEAHYYESYDPRHHEDRNASMNRISEEVIKKAIQKYPNKKFVAVCGEAHANTSPGGIPGIAQLMKVPAVKFAQNGEIEFQPEVRANRVMPPKEVQQFVDQFGLTMMKEYRELQSKNPDIESLNPDDLNEQATKLALQLKSQGRLNGPGDVAKALKRPEAKIAYEKQMQLTKDRASRRAEMRTLIDQGKSDELEVELRKFQQEDPFGHAHEQELAQSKSTLMHYAAEKGQLACIDKLIANGYQVNVLDGNGRTPIQDATKGNSSSGIQKLVALGGDPNLGTGKGAPPPMWVAARTQPGCLKALIDGGANKDIKHSDGKAPIHVAIESGDINRLQALLRNGAIDLNATDADGKTPLHLVVEKGLGDWIQPLLQGGADVNRSNAQGASPLHVAAALGNTALLETLVQGGADLESVDGQGNTPLLLACTSGHGVSALKLLEGGADALAKNQRGEEPLHWAAEMGLNAVVTELIDSCNADLTTVDLDGNTALHRACKGATAKSSGVSDNLIQRAKKDKLSLDQKNSRGETALHLASVQGDNSLVQDLMNNGADDQLKDSFNLTGLEKAIVERFRAETKRQYLSQKTDAHPDLFDAELTEVGIELAKHLIAGDLINDLSGLTTIATQNDFVSQRDAVIQRTMQRAQTFDKAKNAMSADNLTGKNGLSELLAADPGLKYFQDSTDGRSLLHYASLMRKVPAINALAQNGFNLNAPDKEGNTPFHAACQIRKDDNSEKQEQANTVQALIDLKVDVNAQNAKQWTACHFAAWNGNDQALTKLFNASNPAVDLSLTDSRGWTAYDVVVGSSKKDAETVFYTSKKAPIQPLFSDDSQHSTVDILCAATKCENPNHVQLVRDSYEAMYADPNLRPILDLVALDACAERRPPDFAKGIRLFIADDDNSGPLWNALGKGLQSGPRGGLDAEVNVVQVGAKNTVDKYGKKKLAWDADRGDFSGCLVHEMTHAAARIVYGEKCEPFKSSKTKQRYLDAIKKTVEKSNLLCSGNEVENKIRDRITGRMGHYVGKGDAEHELLMEHIVSVPQLIAEFGEENVKDHISDLKSFYDSFTVRCTQTAGSSKYKNERKFVDTAQNTLLETSLLQKWPPPPTKQAFTKQSSSESETSLSLESIMKKIEVQLTIEMGTVDPNSNTQILYTTDQYIISDISQKKQLEKKLAQVRHGLEKVLVDGALPPSLSTNDFRELINNSVGMVKGNTPLNKLDGSIKSMATGWLRDAKINYVEHAVQEKQHVELKDLAEAIILKAEREAQGGTAEVIEFNSKKHQSAVQQLMNDLATVPFEKSLDQRSIYTDVTQAIMTGDASGGFYQKTPKFGKPKPNYVNIKLDNAKREWLNALASL